MKIRLKKRGVLGVKRIALDGKISKIEENEGLHVFIRGLEGLAMIVFNQREIEILKEKLMKKKGKVKKEEKK